MHKFNSDAIIGYFVVIHMKVVFEFVIHRTFGNFCGNVIQCLTIQHGQPPFG